MKQGETAEKIGTTERHHKAMALKIVIIGGVAAGAGAAAKARRQNEQAEIVLFEKGPFISFANCGLPYYVGGDIKDRNDLLIQTPESLWARFRIQVHLAHEVLRINRTDKYVEVRDLDKSAVFQESYDKLILCPGAGAIIPDLPGLPAPNVFTLRTIADSDAIKEWIARTSPERAVIVGAGFIGLEAAEALSHRGLEVTLVDVAPQVLPLFDAEMAAFMARHLEENGIHLALGDGIRTFGGVQGAQKAVLASGRELPFDLAILCMGVRPELKLAREAGLKIGESGGITVNEYQQTSDADIYAAGDAVEVVHLVTGRRTRMPLAGPANKQGRVAGDNAAGGSLSLPGALGTAIVESMGLTAAKTGLTEREASEAGIPYYVSFTHSLDHAGYYPGAELMHIKLVVEKETGRLLGAQIVGENGVDKRIDVLATALSARMDVADLENLDLAYAPQFSAAKDPVVMAGFAAANVARVEVKIITCQSLRDRLSKGDQLQVVDVRAPAEYCFGHIPGSINIPVDELRERFTELDRTRETVVYCRVGFRGYLAARILQQTGFQNVLNLSGGILICPSKDLEGEPERFGKRA